MTSKTLKQALDELKESCERLGYDLPDFPDLKHIGREVKTFDLSEFMTDEEYAEYQYLNNMTGTIQ